MNTRYIKLLAVSLALLPAFTWAQVVFKADFESILQSEVFETVSGEPLFIRNNFERPELIVGPIGNALRLDGWSTFIEESNFELEGINKNLTIEAWYATESFNKESSAIVEYSSTGSGFYLSVGAFGELNFGYHIDGILHVHNTPKRLTPYQWHYIIAIINLEQGEARIYVDGEVWFVYSDLAGETISIPTSSTLFIGRRSLDQEANGFRINVLNGALDEIKISSISLTEAEILSLSTAISERSANLNIDPDIRHAGDHLRPQYHPMPNTSWTNEPYALFYYEDRYHLFFQKNPNAPQLYFMHWGHLSSPDLVHWEEEQIALRPSDGFDSFGMWSGTAIKDPTGKPVLFYTGVDGAKAGIGSATFSDPDLVNWEEDPSNPLIPAPPSGFSHKDFRDPYIWKSVSTYYMIVGSGLNNGGGGILFTYRSTDLLNWTAIPRLYANNDLSVYGEFWEMPSFHNIENQSWLLQILPTPYSGKPARSLYLLGTWENEKFTPYSNVPKSLELFDSHMLAPAFGTDEETRNTYIGIIPEDRDGNDQVKAGWRHTFSLPRQVRLLKDSTIGQIPHPNLCRLRTNEMVLEEMDLDPGVRNNLPDFSGNQIELEFKIKADSNSVFIIQVLKHEDEREFTTLRFDYSSNKIVLDRRQSTLSTARKDTRIGDFVFDPSDTLYVRVFIDHSTLEVFVQNLTIFSSRVYPSRPESNQVDVVSVEGNVTVVSAKKWEIASILGNEVEEVTCLPDFLPDRFNKLPEVAVPLNLRKGYGKALFYPNPTDDLLNVEVPWLENSPYSILDTTGREVLTGDINEGTAQVSIGHLPQGLYFMKFGMLNTVVIKKVVKRN